MLQSDARGAYNVGPKSQQGKPLGGAVSDCEAGLACVFEGDTCPGTCTRAPERCTEGSCGPDAFCASNGTCEARAQVGEACDETQLDFSGQYEPPLGAVGDAVDALVGHRIAEASVHRFVTDVARYLREHLAA